MSITLAVEEQNTHAPGGQSVYWHRGLFAASRVR